VSERPSACGWCAVSSASVRSSCHPPCRLVKLGAFGAELDAECPLVMFHPVQVILPPRMRIPAALDSKVIAITEEASGRRTVFVRFGGHDWKVRSRLEVLSRTKTPAA